jgi:hypothetical protein
MEENFTKKDLKYIQERGNSLEKIEQQLFYFRNGIPKINLVKSAKINNGISLLNKEELTFFTEYFDQQKSKYIIEKFVPASGAASRMFKFLTEFLNKFNLEKETINSYVNEYSAADLAIFIIGLKNFPFYKDLKDKTIDFYANYYSFTSDQKIYFLIKTLLSEEGLNFAQKPKGILPFHKKENKIITSIEENIREAAFYKNNNAKSKIHFTINDEFQSEFETITNEFEDFEITFSYQNQTSDTIAVGFDNEPFRLENNEIFFRPGGHGALIENLNKLTSQIIFIKNIDNVAQNNTKIIELYKKALGGILIKTQNKIFEFLNKLELPSISSVEINEIKQFAEQKLSFPLPEEFLYFQTSFQIEYLKKILNKPIRVCGMVKNEGEPGGGPFWVQDEKGRRNLQIVESSQIDFSDNNQSKIAKSATHFNPVDIVCGVYDYKGNKFDLNQFIDHNTSFITEKTKNGKPIKAQELPGLWNGAMAKWATIFVEVPLETFNPVKTVNDLLKPAHQSHNE